MRSRGLCGLAVAVAVLAVCTVPLLEAGTNVRWLAGYRYPRCLRQEHRARLLEVFDQPTPLLAGVDAVGDRLAVLPSLFHLMWIGDLAAELTSAPLTGSSRVSVGGAVQ